MMATTTMTPAYKKVDEYRDLMNKDREKLIAENLSCVVYLYTTGKGAPAAIGYKGRQRKSALYNCYRSEEERTEHVDKWMSELEGRRKEAKKGAERLLKAGDVLKSSWGYDQTNIDYYLVTELVGKMSVKIVEIGQIRDHSTMDGGKCTPDKTVIKGEPMTKRVFSDRVRLTTYSSAWLIKPEIVAGVEIYCADTWSSGH